MESCLRFEADLGNLSGIRRFVQGAGEALGGDPAGISDVLLSVNEAAANIIFHGYRGQAGWIEIEVCRMGNSLVVFLRDQAPPFDPTAVPAPDVTLPLEQRPLGGMGVHLIRQLMDEVTHSVTPQGGNELTLVKKGVL